MASEWSVLLMGSMLGCEPLPEEPMPEIVCKKTRPIRPVGLPRPSFKHVPLHHLPDIPSSSKSTTISPLLSSTVCHDSSLQNITVSSSLLDLPPSPIAAAMRTPREQSASPQFASTPEAHEADHNDDHPSLCPSPSPQPTPTTAVVSRTLDFPPSPTSSSPCSGTPSSTAAALPNLSAASGEAHQPETPEAVPTSHATPAMPEGSVLIPLFPCETCGLTYKVKRSLHRHMKSHTDPVKCEPCGRTFCHSDALKRHHANKHMNIVYPCKICLKSFQSKYGLQMHEREHAEDYRFICDICGDGFNYLVAFQAHMNKHMNIRPYVCDNCGKDFDYQQALSRHKKVCSNESSVPCTVCGKILKAARYLEQHMALHRPADRQHCHLCGKTYSHRSSMNRHMKREHSS